MLANIRDFLARRADTRAGAHEGAALPAVAAPSAIPEEAADQSQARMAAIRESIDLIEIDLATMIRDVQRASDAVRGGTRATADLLGAISGQSEQLATMAGQATEGATHLAVATEEFAKSSDEIGRQVREAGTLTDDAGHAAAAAGRSVDGLNASSAEIGNVVLPVHNRIYSQPQKGDDVAWNLANCRNRRIFDDRAGLSAARNGRPSLIQSYARDMGNGVVIMMREIDAPVRVFGKHWGGFRTAYKI